MADSAGRRRESPRRLPIPVAEQAIADRVRSVVASLEEHRLDALLVAFSPNLRYLSGFTGSNGNLLITREKALLFTDPRYAVQIAAQTSPPIQARIAKGPLALAVTASIARLRLKRIGFEPARMTCETRDALTAGLPLGASLHAVSGWIERMRMVKTSAEISAVRRSVEINSAAFEESVRRVKPGMSEQDLAAEIEYRMRRLGAGKPSFDTIVAGGSRSALPHAQPSSAALRTGDLVVVDMGAMWEGYASDMTRMLFLGAPGVKVRRAYKAVLEAQLAAVDAVRAGVAAGSVDRAARSVLKSHGLDRAFVHSTGHGLGLEIHEPPRIGRREAMRLDAGMTITIEPGVYIEGWGGIRIEDTVAVTATGCEVLTPTSKDLRII